jgi:hypothetical protein
MPDASLSEALKEAYTLAPSNVAVIDTLQISHPSLPGGDIFICCNTEAITCLLETEAEATFQPCAFSIQRPQSGDQGLSNLPIAIDNIDQVFTDFINQVKNSSDPVSVTYRPYLSNNLLVPQMVPPIILFLTDITVTETQVQGNCTFMDIINKPFPTQNYTRTRFPGLANTYAQ